MVDQERQAPSEEGEDTPEDAAGAIEDAATSESVDGVVVDDTSEVEPIEGEEAVAPAADSEEPVDAAGGAEAEGDELSTEEDGAAAAAEGEGDDLATELTEGESGVDGLEATPESAEAAGEDDAEPAADEPADEVDGADVEGTEVDGPEAAEPEATAEPAPGDEAAAAAEVEASAAAAASVPAVTGPPVGRWRRREARPRPPTPSRYTTEAPEWIQPEFEHQAVEAPSPPLGRSPGRLPAVILAILMSGVFLLFVLIEPTPTWLLLFGSIMAALGTDGVLRSIRHRIFEREDGPDTVPHIFLPTLFALSIPLFIEENLESYWVIPAALAAGVTFVLVVLAEVPAEEAEDDEFRGRARFVSVAATYFVAFALFSLTYTFKLQLHESFIVAALVSVLLAVELLREGEIDPLETLLLAGVVGVVVAEARWVLKYLPIDAYPAGLSLVLVFYFVTGMVHAYMTRHINLTVAAEYSIVTVLGLALVVAARATGIA